jgi:hypothetical protein
VGFFDPIGCAKWIQRYRGVAGNRVTLFCVRSGTERSRPVERVADIARNFNAFCAGTALAQRGAEPVVCSTNNPATFKWWKKY